MAEQPGPVGKGEPGQEITRRGNVAGAPGLRLSDLAQNVSVRARHPSDAEARQPIPLCQGIDGDPPFVDIGDRKRGLFDNEVIVYLVIDKPKSVMPAQRHKPVPGIIVQHNARRAVREIHQNEPRSRCNGRRDLVQIQAERLGMQGNAGDLGAIR